MPSPMTRPIHAGETGTFYESTWSTGPMARAAIVLGSGSFGADILIRVLCPTHPSGDYHIAVPRTMISHLHTGVAGTLVLASEKVAQ